MELYTQISDCCGCGACQSICPKSAITMTPDSEGFFYPKIQNDLCIDCGLCRQVCPMRTENTPEYGTFSPVGFPIVYAAKANDVKIRSSSSSGGIFPLISHYLLKQNGSVYGAVITESHTIAHKRSITPKECEHFRGSKYVQSDLNTVFSQVKSDLCNGLPVLFSGTPCQILGLKNYLSSTDQTNLVLCDLVCHGVASPKIWMDYLNCLNKKFPQAASSFQFKNKQNGWHTATVSIEHHHRLITQNPILQSFQNLYFAGMISRPCCCHCKFANTNRFSDITLGDFWGIEKIMPDFDDNQGVSLILIHTQKGFHLFQSVREETTCRQSTLSDCLQPQLQHPVVFSPIRSSFWKTYRTHGFSHAIRKYSGCSYRNRLKQKLRTLLLMR